jgi:hypothetical protein
MVGLGGGEMEAEAVGKWGVCWGAAEGRTEVLFGLVGKVVGWKNWEDARMEGV